jgi:hypothetical protein
MCSKRTGKDWDRLFEMCRMYTTNNNHNDNKDQKAQEKIYQHVSIMDQTHSFDEEENSILKKLARDMHLGTKKRCRAENRWTNSTAIHKDALGCWINCGAALHHARIVKITECLTSEG